MNIEKENKMAKLIEQQFEQPKFSEWFSSLADVEGENMVPDVLKTSMSYQVSKSVHEKEHALKYFERNVWPSVLAQLRAELI